MICDCGHAPSEHLDITTGYSYDKDDKTYCYDCSAKIERQSMVDTGRAILYLTQKDGVHYVTDWPGRLRFRTGIPQTSKHNIARIRRDVWFHGPDDHVWHGVQYGDNSDLCYCKRTKEKEAN